LIAAVAVGTTAGAQRINHFFDVERTCLQQTDLFGFYIARFADAIPVDSSHICYSGRQSCAIGAIAENDSSFVIIASFCDELSVPGPEAVECIGFVQNKVVYINLQSADITLCIM